MPDDRYRATHSTKCHVWSSLKQQWKYIQDIFCYFFVKLVIVNANTKIRHQDTLYFENKIALK